MTNSVYKNCNKCKSYHHISLHYCDNCGTCAYNTSFCQACGLQYRVSFGHVILSYVLVAIFGLVSLVK